MKHQCKKGKRERENRNKKGRKTNQDIWLAPLPNYCKKCLLFGLVVGEQQAPCQSVAQEGGVRENPVGMTRKNPINFAPK